MRVNTAHESRRLALEVHFEAEPIHGRLYDLEDGGLGRPFFGWLGLMSAIDAARRPRKSPPRMQEGELNEQA